MSHNHFGVKYPDGTWSGPISPTAKDLKPYAREHHGTVYEVGTAEDPGRLCQRQGEPWVFDDDLPRTITAADDTLAGHDFRAGSYEQAAGRIERITADNLAAKFGAV